MLSKLKAAWARLASGGRNRRTRRASSYPHRIQRLPHQASPVPGQGPLPDRRQHREQDTPEGVKEHRFIRADTYASRDDAIAFTISKAKQIVDQQGDAIFK